MSPDDFLNFILWTAAAILMIGLLKQPPRLL